ncbi:glycosyltransferase family 2 protein [Parasutterella muris]|uniref:Glycosyltransferase n=1 Tax=Parasutterella muris TaxID=2565572 RepID=A0A6L6YFP0_9BURK|nr:glycosyltransferase family 2 protein [Parasutterella muris]MVX56470.1 glycosyltransferase [Parasutterella muris]
MYSKIPLVSILVPCFNVEKYVRECLESIKNQTLTDIEVICINDGSTDSTLSILEEFAAKDCRFRIINKKNSGYGDSMNKGLDSAKGKYIGIVESDDFVEETMFEKICGEAESKNLQISRCCYNEYKQGLKTPINNDWVPKNKVFNPNENQAPFWQAPAIWSAIYDRNWLNGNNIRFLPTPGASYQDTSFAFKCYACCDRFQMINENLLNYRTDNENSSVNNPNKVFCVCDEWNEIYNFVRNMTPGRDDLLVLMPVLQYGTYKWNYERLGTKKLKNKFLRVWVKELFAHFIKGELPLHKLDSSVKTKIKGVLLKTFFNHTRSI